MASTYSTNLKLELIGTGEQSGVWGTTTNTNMGTAIEQAIVGKGSPVFSTDADLTLTLSNSSAAQTARAFVLNVTSGVSLTTTRNLVVPTIEKPYVVMNNTTGGQSIVVKTAAGSGITVPNGGQVFLYVDGTNVIQMLDAFGDLTYTGTLTGGTGVVNLGGGQVYKAADGKVGIGTASPTTEFQVNGNGDITRVTNGTRSAYVAVDSAGFTLLTGAGQTGNGIYAKESDNSLQLLTNGSGKATLDASGNFGLGVTPSAWRSTYRAYEGGRIGNALAFSTSGSAVELLSNAYIDASNLYIYANNGLASDYYQVNGYHQWYTAPSGTAGNQITFTPAMTLDATALTGGTDNARNLGSGATRWAVVYAATGTINTSDAREKTAVRAMAADEIEAAKALSKEIGVYQFLDSVAVKGDKARHHIGMTVQRAIEIMEVNGLNPFAYGFICYDKWDEQNVEHPAIEACDAVEAKDAVLDDEGNVVEPAVEAQPAIEAKDAWTEVTLKAGDRYSFRYDQLTLFIARGLHAEIEAMQAQIDAQNTAMQMLATRLAALEQA